MSRLMSAVWLIQVVLLLVAGLVCVIRPSIAFYILEECRVTTAVCQCTQPASSSSSSSSIAPLAASAEACCVPRGLCTHPEVCCEPEIDLGGQPVCAQPTCMGCEQILTPGRKACLLMVGDQEAQGLLSLVRMLAPFLLAFALLSGHAAMREDEHIRRNLSFIFAWVYVVLVILLATNAFSVGRFSEMEFPPRALFAMLITLILVSIFGAMRAADRIQRALSLVSVVGFATLAVAEHRGTPFPTLIKLAAALFLLDLLVGGLERLRSQVFAVVLGSPVIFAIIDPLYARILHEQVFVATTLHEKHFVTQVLLWYLFFCFAVHSLYAAWPVSEEARRLSGAANTRPSSLWVLWLVQGLVYIIASALLVAGHKGNGTFILKPFEHGGYHELFREVQNLFPAFMVAMGLVSFSGLAASREWVWKTLCGIYVVFYAAVTLDMMFVWNSAILRAWVPALFIAPIGLFFFHLHYLRKHRDWFTEEVGEGPDGWIALDLALGPMMLLKTLLTGRRATNARGVAAWGTVKMLPKGEHPYPDHDLLVPGMEYPLEARFSNERSSDDAEADARGVALRLSNTERSPFDLLLSTGAYTAAENVVELGLIRLMTALGPMGRRWLARRRHFLEGGIAALRRAPESYARLYYYSQTVRFWVAQDNERYLVRYRMVPWPLPEEESGLPVTREDYIHRARSKDERRPRDYLRRDLKMRLEGALYEGFRLQGQFHRIEPADGLHWYNPAADWKSQDHPWIDLAEIKLEDTLSDADAEALCFDPNNVPQSLGTPVARGLYDYRSIADSERRVMRRVQGVRRWISDVFGPPKGTEQRME